MKILKTTFLLALVALSCSSPMHGMWRFVRASATRVAQACHTRAAGAWNYTKQNNNASFGYKAPSWRKPSFALGIAVASSIIAKNIVLAHAEKQDAKQTMPPASVWQLANAGDGLSKPELIKQFFADCQALADQENQAIPKHTPNENTVRIATYNVHFWQPADREWKDAEREGKDADNRKSFDKIIATIKSVNADILVLQEVRLSEIGKSLIMPELKKAGYTFIIFKNTKHPKETPFGNMIVSKYPIIESSTKTYDADQKIARERRNYIKVKVALPGQQQFAIYGTHLDVYDESEKLRTQEVQELIDTAQRADEPCMILGDCNAVRESDYQYTVQGKKVWDLLTQAHKNRTHREVPTAALKRFEQNNFTDCFAKSNQTFPKFTVWTGTAVDFIWLNQQWKLPIAGSYVYYSAASDHFPIITDVKISKDIA